MSTYPRVMLAAGSSGSGKTMITCGLLQILKNRGYQVASFKCGPDYIDPMFHEKVIHTKSRNLDTFFTGEEMTRYLFERTAKSCDISVMEGVMGFYDGLGGISDKASAYDLAKVTDTPVVLIVNTKGMSLSVLAYLKGYLTFRTDHTIKGIILNQMSPMIYKEMKALIEAELGVKVLGYVPKLPADLSLESRHLGLVLPNEIEELSEKLQKMAEVLEESLEIEEILKLAKEAEELKTYTGPQEKIRQLREKFSDRKPVKIAVARDEAFCFIYEDNLQLLRELGAEILEFSPISDQTVPEEADGVLLYGGYPELYAKELSDNRSMLRDLKEKFHAGLPIMAECGGFMYLHKTMEDMERKSYDMVGIIDGKAYKTEKLGRFGYIELNQTEQEWDANQVIRGHEFHYFDSTNCGESYLAKKPLRKRSWKCIHKKEHLMAGFPHLYYYSNPDIIYEYLEQCMEYGKGKNQNEIFFDGTGDRVYH